MQIKICYELPKVYNLKKKLTLAFPNENIIIKRCIGMCKICKNQPTCKIKGKKFKAKNVSSLIEKLAKSI